TTLRQHIARCLLDAADLQRPPLPPGSAFPLGEVPVALSLARASAHVLRAVWTEPDEAIARARAEWLLANVFVDHAALLRTVQLGRMSYDDRENLALTIVDLLLDPFIYSVSRAERDAVDARYLAWLRDRVL